MLDLFCNLSHDTCSHDGYWMFQRWYTFKHFSRLLVIILYQPSTTSWGINLDVDHLPSMLFLHTLPSSMHMHSQYERRKRSRMYQWRGRRIIFHEDKRGACIHIHIFKPLFFKYRKHQHDDTHLMHTMQMTFVYLCLFFIPKSSHCSYQHKTGKKERS